MRRRILLIIVLAISILITGCNRKEPVDNSQEERVITVDGQSYKITGDEISEQDLEEIIRTLSSFFDDNIISKDGINSNIDELTQLDIKDRVNFYEISLGDSILQIEKFEPEETEEIKFDRRPMVRVGDAIYLDTNNEINTDNKNIEIEGTITSRVPQSEIPVENNQANVDIIGSSYSKYGEDIIVNINDKWYLFKKDLTHVELYWEKSGLDPIFFNTEDTIQMLDVTYSGDSVSFLLKNNSESIIYYGDSVSMEKRNKDDWYMVPFSGDIGFTSQLNFLDPGKNIKIQLPINIWTKLYPGNYRIIQMYSFDSRSKEIRLLSGEFEIP